MSSPSSIRSSALHWGQACIHCRRRKMRCDGTRPICGQCSRANRAEDCQYKDSQGRTKMEVLEESISRVESRIRELENPQEQGPSVVLSDPYLINGSFSDSAVPPMGYDLWTLPEPSLEIKTVLIDRFLDCASEYGFFLNVSRFRSAALDPSAYYSRPLPALMTTVYLLGTFLSHTTSSIFYEKALLERALTDVSGALSNNHHPQKFLQTIQAEILLSYYFLASGRFLEGKYHVTTAVSLGLSTGLTKIRSDRNASTCPMSILPAPQDAIEEGERVDACWTGLILDKCWAVALASVPNSKCPSDIVGIQVDTPWPLEINDYENGGFPSSMMCSFTIQNYLKGAPASGGNEMSTKALHVKASLLWERATDLIRNWKPDMDEQEAIDFYASFAALDGLLEDLRSSLPVPDAVPNPTSVKRRTLFVVHNLTYAAVMQLYGLFAKVDKESKGKVLMAARGVFRMTGIVPHGLSINPIIGTVWVSAGQVLLEELVALRASRSAHDPAKNEETELFGIFNAGFQDMIVLAESCILLKYQVMQIQEAFATL